MEDSNIDLKVIIPSVIVFLGILVTLWINIKNTKSKLIIVITRETSKTKSLYQNNNNIGGNPVDILQFIIKNNSRVQININDFGIILNTKKHHSLCQYLYKITFPKILEPTEEISFSIPYNVFKTIVDDNKLVKLKFYFTDTCDKVYNKKYSE